jgi:hypothetical protein
MFFLLLLGVLFLAHQQVTLERVLPIKSSMFVLVSIETPNPTTAAAAVSCDCISGIAPVEGGRNTTFLSS